MGADGPGAGGIDDLRGRAALTEGPEEKLAALDAVVAALAHPARRQILLTIHFRGAATAGEIAGRFAHKWPTTTRHLRVLEDARVPCGPVNDLQDVFSDAHVIAREAELRMPCDWAEGGEIGLLANPLKMSVTPPSYRRPPPRLNEHADDVLADWVPLYLIGKESHV